MNIYCGEGKSFNVKTNLATRLWFCVHSISGVYVATLGLFFHKICPFLNIITDWNDPVTFEKPVLQVLYFKMYHSFIIGQRFVG